MIRTNSVTLATVPNAIAYRLKMASGDAGIVIVRGDEPQPGTATISKSTGKPVISANTPAGAYPEEAFEEAIALTAGMPYRKQGKPAPPEMAPLTEEPKDGSDPAGTTDEDEVIVNGVDYAKVVDTYVDKRGRLSYDLLNKDLIQLAHKSDVVASMIAEGATDEDIWLHVVGTRFRGLTGNRNLKDEEIIAMASLIDDVSPKGAFKELNSEVRKMISKSRPKNRQ